MSISIHDPVERAAEKEQVRKMMHTKRMCSVCDIARATGLDTEVVKPLMVELANECAWFTSRLRKDMYTSEETGQICKLYAEGVPYKDIAKALGRNMHGVCGKILALQRDGVLPRKYRKREESKNA